MRIRIAHAVIISVVSALFFACSPLAGRIESRSIQYSGTAYDQDLALTPIDPTADVIIKNSNYILSPTVKTDIVALDMNIGKLFNYYSNNSSDSQLRPCVDDIISILIGAKEYHTLALHPRANDDALQTLHDTVLTETPPDYARAGDPNYNRDRTRALITVLVGNRNTHTVAELTCGRADNRWSVVNFIINVDDLNNTDSAPTVNFNPLAQG